MGTSISSYSWTYDTHGRAASFTAPEGTFAYGYDDTHELISATFTVASGYTGGTPASETFSFDNTGNRTGGGNSVTKNRLMSDGTYNYTYDGEGNRTSRTHIATGQYVLYSWDHRNRLTRVEFRNTSTGPATKIVANTYDAFDRRVMKQVDTNADGDFTDPGDRTERYVWDGDQISLVLDANGAVLHRFLHGPAIDQVFADEDSVNGLLWDLGDNQNTTRDVINNSGTVVNHVTYSPFGVIASESDPTKTPFAAYTGGDWDEDLGLLLLGHRWLEAPTGRWLSEDPIRFAAGDPNLQRYVGNAPTNFVDPSGLDDRLVSEALPSGMIALYRERDPSLFASLFGAVPERDFVGFLDYDPKAGSVVRRHGPGSEDYNRILPYEDVAAAVNGGYAGDDLSALFPRSQTLSIGDSPTFFGIRTETGLKECAKLRREVVGEVKHEIAMAALPAFLPRSGPIHHIATNKNWDSTLRGGPWSPRFAKIFKKAGMTLEDAANKVRIPGHVGPHPEPYHQAIFDRLITATDGLSGTKYTEALVNELEAIAIEASTPGTILNKLLTK